MILSRNMLKRVGESRHPCQTPTVVRNQSAVRVDCTNGLVTEVFDGSDEAGGDVVFLDGCPQRARQTLSKAFLKSLKIWKRSCWCWRYFSQRILRLKICSMVLLPALKPSYSSAMIFSAYTFILFSIFSMTLLGWLMWLIVR